MESTDPIKAKVAKALLTQHDSKKRKRLNLIYLAALIVLFLIHNYSANIATPLKLIPQTMSAIGMGYVLTVILSLRKFAYIAEFIDWSKVNESADQD